MKKISLLDSRIFKEKGYDVVNAFVYLSIANKLIISNSCCSNDNLRTLKVQLAHFIRHLEKTKDYIVSKKTISRFKSEINYIIKDLEVLGFNHTSVLNEKLTSSSNIFELLQLLSTIIIIIQNNVKDSQHYSELQQKINILTNNMSTSYDYSLSKVEILYLQSIQMSINKLL